MIFSRGILALAVLLLIGAACGSTVAAEKPDAARQTCEAEAHDLIAGYSQSISLVAALPTTAGATAHWEYTHSGPNGPRPLVSRWSALPADQRVVFCYFDGDYSNFLPPMPRGAQRDFERALVIATEGEHPWVDHIGPKATNPLVAP